MQKIIDGRIPQLDALRALAAILGVILHAAGSYLTYPVPQWPHFGKSSNLFFDCLTHFIHMFRVPVFFFLAGFFGYQLLIRLHYRGFIKNRCQRILLPFLLFSFLLNIPTFLTVLLNPAHTQSLAFTFSNLSYLWFLEYLIIYYILFLTFSFVLQFVNTEKINLKINQWCRSGWMIPAIMIVSYACLLPTQEWYLPIFLSFTPNLYLLSIYGLYFGLGIILAKHFDCFDHFFRWRWKALAFGICCYGINFSLFLSLHTSLTRDLAMVFYVISSYLLFSCFIGFCNVFFVKRNAVIRYLADASYWIYLVHIFFLMTVHSLSSQLHSIFTQFAVTVSMTLLLSLLSYHLLFERGSKKSAFNT
jgi:glucan biosynthesis protein C